MDYIHTNTADAVAHIHCEHTHAVYVIYIYIYICAKGRQGEHKAVGSGLWFRCGSEVTLRFHQIVSLTPSIVQLNVQLAQRVCDAAQTTTREKKNIYKDDDDIDQINSWRQQIGVLCHRQFILCESVKLALYGIIWQFINITLLLAGYTHNCTAYRDYWIYWLPHTLNGLSRHFMIFVQLPTGAFFWNTDLIMEFIDSLYGYCIWTIMIDCCVF